jgi:hypothetical protein
MLIASKGSHSTYIQQISKCGTSTEQTLDASKPDASAHCTENEHPSSSPQKITTYLVENNHQATPKHTTLAPANNPIISTTFFGHSFAALEWLFVLYILCGGGVGVGLLEFLRFAKGRREFKEGFLEGVIEGARRR